MEVETVVATIMDNRLYKAAIKGDVDFLMKTQQSELAEGSDEYFRKKTYGNNNIIHIATREQQLEFIEVAVNLKSFPQLILEQNSNGDTPVHEAAEVGHMRIVELLVSSCNKAFADQEGEGVKPWRVKNKEGNTALHVALINGKVEVAAYLVELDPLLVGFVNKFKETPLHLAVKYRVDGDTNLARTVIKQIDEDNIYLQYKGCKLGENSESVIQLLLQKDSSIACLRDINGFTPLHKAACPHTARVFTISAILDHCPQSVEICDLSGKNILHHLKQLQTDEVEGLLKLVSELGHLKDKQDKKGDTPVHIASRNNDANMVQLLLEYSANFTLKNKNGVSAASLIQQDINFPKITKPQSEVDKNSKETAEDTIKMGDEVCKAIESRDVRFLMEEVEKDGKKLLLCRGPTGGNIIHEIIIRNEEDLLIFEGFIEAALDRLPSLICQTNSVGNTPLHAFMKSIYSYPEEICRGFIMKCKLYFEKAQEEAALSNQQFYYPPWRIKNLLEGETPLHIGLWGVIIIGFDQSQCRKIKMLLELDHEMAADVNKDGQTPLHLLCFTSRGVVELNDFKVLIRDIREANPSAINTRDGLGRTPLMIAIQHENRPLVNLFRELISEWHTPIDIDGNTPLHQAIEQGNFGLAQLLIEQHSGRLLGKNKNGVKVCELIGSADHLPPEFEKFIWGRLDRMIMMLGWRSMYGIPTKQIKDYTQTIGLIAVLLATVSFTAAFTVPGGYNSNNTGTSTLLKNVAFQVFMVSNILSMCLSILVLFCLLRVIVGSEKRFKILLLDVMIFSQQVSFDTTLLSFMTGIYVTTFPIRPWVAILACILCSSLILLLHKRFVRPFTIICFYIHFIVQVLFHIIKRSLQDLYRKVVVTLRVTQGHPHSNQSGEVFELSDFCDILRQSWSIFLEFVVNQPLGVEGYDINF